MEVSFGTSVEEIKVGGIKKYAPAYVLGGTPHIVCEQGNVVYYDTPEEAQEYFDEDED